MKFSELARYLKKLEDMSSRISMTETLSDLFTKSGSEEIDKICYLSQGRLVPIYDPLEFGMAEKLIIKSVAISCSADQDEVARDFKKAGDMGVATENVKLRLSKSKQNVKNTDPDINEVYRKLFDIASLSGEGSQEQKISGLADLIKSVDPLASRYLVRIPLDKLRLGFSEMTILDALSWMLKGDKSLRSTFEDAYNVRPDIGYISKQVKLHGAKWTGDVKAKVGAPILASLCQRLPTADEMIKKMGQVAVEPKYDGMRVQIHYQKIEDRASKTEKIGSYSRNLENTTNMFPELEHIGKQINAESVILDSEVVGIDPKTGKIRPFQETTTRKRKHQVDLFSQEAPVKFFVFDILYKDGKDLLSEPLSGRRKILEDTVKSGTVLEVSPQIVTDQIEVLRQYHDKQLKLGLEGAVVKKWNSPYEPGRRGFSWVKFKEEEGKTGKLTDTIDCVVMGYYRGEGKRTDFGIGAFLVGVRDGESFVTVTKIGTGVTDKLWHELYNRFEKIKTDNKPKQYREVNKIFIPDVWIEPKIVVEIAGDDLTKSPSHGAGYAIRFPRLVRIREDKRPENCTTTREIKNMYHNQKTAKA